MSRNEYFKMWWKIWYNLHIIKATRFASCFAVKHVNISMAQSLSDDGRKILDRGPLPFGHDAAIEAG